MKHNNRYLDEDMRMMLEAVTLVENELQRVAVSIDLSEAQRDVYIHDCTTRLISLRTAVVEAVKSQYANSKRKRLKAV